MSQMGKPERAVPDRSALRLGAMNNCELGALTGERLAQDELEAQVILDFILEYGKYACGAGLGYWDAYLKGNRTAGPQVLVVRGSIPSGVDALVLEARSRFMATEIISMDPSQLRRSHHLVQAALDRQWPSAERLTSEWATVTGMQERQLRGAEEFMQAAFEYTVAESVASASALEAVDQRWSSGEPLMTELMGYADNVYDTMDESGRPDLGSLALEIFWQELEDELTQARLRSMRQGWMDHAHGIDRDEDDEDRVRGFELARVAAVADPDLLAEHHLLVPRIVERARSRWERETELVPPRMTRRRRRTGGR